MLIRRRLNSIFGFRIASCVFSDTLVAPRNPDTKPSLDTREALCFALGTCVVSPQPALFSTAARCLCVVPSVYASQMPFVPSWSLVVSRSSPFLSAR